MISYIVPTIGRDSLSNTLRSIEVRPGDEILVVGDNLHKKMRTAGLPNSRAIRHIQCPPGNDWGHFERNFATPFARGRYIAHIDDDDVYVPGTRALMEDAARANPGRPVIFRMEFPCGIVLWREPVIQCGNLGTPCFLIPNRPTMMGTWGSFVGGDCHFLETSKWKHDEYVWRPEVIAKLGHNIG